MAPSAWPRSAVDRSASGAIRQMEKYARSVRSSFETQGYEGAREIPVPDLALVESQLAVPAMALGQLVGVLMVESTLAVAFTPLDEAHLTVIASILANAIEADRPAPEPEQRPSLLLSLERRCSRDRCSGPAALEPAAPETEVARAADATHVRCYEVDGSTFVDGDYLIKGVAGRILWSVLATTNVTVGSSSPTRSCGSTLAGELPQFRDNLDSRLLLLKRRLDERDGTIRIVKSGRGRFRLDLDTPVRLELVPAT